MKDTANQSLDANREKMVWNENNIEKAMKELQSLSRINEMVDRILEITSQTNLLSLNASIEPERQERDLPLLLARLEILR